jgi:hypothetical protein
MTQWGTKALQGMAAVASQSGHVARDGGATGDGGGTRDENGTKIFRTDRFRFLYYEPFFNMKNCQFQLVSQPFLTIFCTL